MAQIDLCLQDLLRKLKEASIASAYLNNKDSVNQDIKSIIKRVYIATALHDKTVFSIMGGQGAGKTKLLRSLYDLDTRWLSDNEGRGEKLPVLILESDEITEPYASIDRMTEDESGNLMIEQGAKVLSPEDFQQAIRGEFTNSLLPTLNVPRRYFNDNKSGFVLLPGYEQVNSQNKVWQNLMKHALAFSSGAIVVTDQTRLANASQVQINKDIKEKYFTDSKPLFVVSKTESLPDADKPELLERCQSIFSVPEHELDRIVLVGDGDAYTQQWRTELDQALNIYALQNTQSVDEKSYLIRELLEDLQDVECNLNDMASDSEVAKLSENRLVDEFLTIFDDSAKRIRSGYQKTLREELNLYSSPVHKNLDDVYKDKYEGVINKGKHFFKSSIDLSRDVNADIEKQWNEAGDTKEGFKEQYGCVLSEVVAKESTRIWPNITPLPSDTDLLEEGGADIDEGVIKIIQNIFSQKESTPLQAYEKRDFKTAIKILPVLMLEYVRLGQQLKHNPLHLKGDIKAADILGPMNAIAKDMESFSGSSKKIIKAMASMLAADVIMDGQIDTIPAFINAVSGEAVAAGSLASSATLIVPAIIGVAFGIHSILERIAEIDKARLGYIRTSIESISENHYQSYLNHFNDLIELLRDTLKARLSSIYGIDDNGGHKHALFSATTNLERTRIDMMEVMDNHHVLA